MVAFLPLLLAVSLQQPANLSVPVSAEYRATRLELLLPALSKEWKIPLRCEPALENTPLILRVDRAPLKEAMDKIAEATVGKWVKMPQGWELRRDRDALVRLSQEAREEEVRILDRELRDQLDRLKASPMTPEALRPVISSAFAREQEMMTGGNVKAPADAHLHNPAIRLGLRLLKAIGARTLQAIDQQERAVFASNPTSMQRPFGDGFQTAWELFEQESSAFVAVRDEVAESRRPMGLEPLLSTIDPGKVAKVVLDINQTWKSPEWPLAGSTLLLFYDESGKNLRFLELDPTRSKLERADDLQIAGATQPIRFGAMAEELRAQFATVRSGGAPRSLSQEVRNALLNPEGTDPLAFAPSDGLLDIAKQGSLNTAAVLPDESAMIGGRLPSVGDIKPALFLSLVRVLARLKETVDQGWWVVRPLDPGVSEGLRSKRDALGQAIRNTMSTMRFGLREQAVWAASAPTMPMLVREHLVRIEPGEYGWVGIDTNAPLLARLIGALDNEKWSVLERGEPLPLESLSQAQHHLVRLLVMSFRDVVESRDHAEGARGRPLQVDSTEAYPTGLPEGFAMRMAVEPETAVFAVPKGGKAPGGAYAPWQAARAMYFDKNPGHEQDLMPGERPWPEGFVVARSRKLTFHFQMEPGVALTQSIKDSVAPDRKVLPYTELPQDYRARVEQEYKAVERQYSGGAP